MGFETYTGSYGWPCMNSDPPSPDFATLVGVFKMWPSWRGTLCELSEGRSNNHHMLPSVFAHLKFDKAVDQARGP